MTIPDPLVFLHLRNTRNIGDRWCSPYDWFDWPDTAQPRDLRETGAPYRHAILGGGKIFGGLSTYPGVQSGPDTINIAWGVSTVQNFMFSRRYTKARRLTALIGSRDFGYGKDIWAPCPSCMAPHFDAPPEPEHDVVFYAHGGKTQAQGITIPDHIPSNTNNIESLDAALNFIASGRTVISNSYHGTYWALLMGRKVICVPFSKKFLHFREAPAYATPKDWLSKLGDGIARPDMLRLCRAATRDFRDRVLQKIETEAR